MAETFVKIRIQSEADLEALRRAGLEIKGVETAAESATGVLGNLFTGFGQGVGQQVLTSLAQIPGAILDATRRGIAFNATMGDSEIAIANVLRQFQGLSKEAAKDEAAKAMAQIVELEPKTAGTLQTLVAGFLSTAAASQAAGVSVEQNIELVGKFANALANANIPAEQLTQELRAIFTGNITPDAALGKLLKITNEDVRLAKEAGTLYDLLSQKIGSLGEAGDTFAVATSTLSSNLDKLLGTVTKPFFDELKAGIDQVNAAFSDPQTQQEIQRYTGYVRTLVQVVKDVNAGGNFVAGILDDKLASARNAGAGLRRALGLPEPEAPLPVAREAEKEVPTYLESLRAVGQADAEIDKNRAAWEKLREAIAKANAEVDAAAEKFAASGRTPEAALQASIERLRALRQELAGLTGLGEDADAADFQAAGRQLANPEVLAKTKELLELNGRINEEAQKISVTNAEALQAEGKRAAQAKTFLADLEAQRKIEEARLAGNDALVENLERQRALAGQLAQIQEADLAPGEKERAADLARQTSELERQIALKKQLDELQGAEADLAVEQAKAKGGQRGIDRAETEKLRGEKFRELRGKVGESEARRLADEFAEAEAKRRLRERGGFGNPRGFNAPPQGLTTGSSLGTTPSDDFLALKRGARELTQQPIGELLGPPAPAGGVGAAADGGLGTAGSRLQSGAEQLTQAATQLGTAGDRLSGAADAVEAAATAVENGGSSLESAALNLQGAASGLDSRLAALESAVQALQDASGN